VVFPVGNLAPEGAVIKATALDRSVVGDDHVYRHRGPARVFVDERDAIRAVKGGTEHPIRAGDVMVLIGNGPSGTGMQETAQITPPPADARLWAALQQASGGTWAGCVYDVDRIVAALEAGLNLTKEVQ